MPAGARFGVAEGREEGGAELERCWEAEWGRGWEAERGGPRQVAWEAAVAEVERRGQGATPEVAEAERRDRTGARCRRRRSGAAGALCRRRRRCPTQAQAKRRDRGWAPSTHRFGT